ncbi:DUF4239 domain-containing protein [Legionella feeleii]|uniref:DUF4239 domain-containing protein n=1 Tax=Legionella feeleii TaxID=453 RepID=A0A0W0U9M4_9GAMM|nr:DUF4239 domain-containing protein [Legionella feeleii]KTD04365.1 hypothetical protein Lfee_0192 [Legionella feeleii]SPX62840.1 Uncharacterised protein [Legionella feeleii]STX38120.1 Uncharacterised protein [Legionella feeleii]
MFRTIVNTLHPTVFYFFISIIYVGFAIVAYVIATKIVPSKRLKDDRFDEAVSMSLGLVNGVYSILLGFLLFLIWENYETAEQVVVDEGSKLTIMWEGSRVFPASVAKGLQEAIEQYAREVAEEEWPAMAYGEQDADIPQLLSNLYTIIQSYSPETTVTQTFYSEILSALNAVMELRNHRLSLLKSAIPAAWYIFIFFVAFVLILLNALSLRRHSMQLYMHILLTLVITFYLTAITALSYPFSGYISVDKSLFLQGSLQKIHQ